MGIVGAFMVPHPPLIVPDVGNGGEKQIEETAKAYEKVAEMVAELKPQVIVVSSPHSVMYADYFHISPGNSARGSFAGFGAPHVKMQVNYDRDFAMSLAMKCSENGIDAGTLGEKDENLDHGTMVPLYFIMKKYLDFKLVRLGLSGFSLAKHYQYGMLIKEIARAQDKRVVYIASGDLSHKLREDGPYGLDEAGPIYDQRIMDVMGNGSFDELLDFDESFLNKAAECGHRSFVMMAGALDRTAVEIGRLSHQDVTGVGYGICTYIPTGESEDRAFLDKWRARKAAELEEKRQKEDPYVRLARLSLESYVTEGRTISWEWVKEKVIGYAGLCLENETAGTFVSLHIGDSLRGCIGTIMPTRDCIAHEIIENAISAASKDPRFSPVTEDELPLIDISVDVLGEIEDIRSQAELDVKRYGVIVTKGSKRGLLLPNLEGIDDVETQIEIAKRKAGIPVYEEDVELQRFEVVRHY